MLHGKIVSYTLSFSFVVLSSTKLSYAFIIFLSLRRNFIFCDHLGLIFCFSHCLFTYFLENSFFPTCARKKYILFSTFVIICDLTEECFFFWFDRASPQFLAKAIWPHFQRLLLLGNDVSVFPTAWTTYITTYITYISLISIREMRE